MGGGGRSWPRHTAAGQAWKPGHQIPYKVCLPEIRRLNIQGTPETLALLPGLGWVLLHSSLPSLFHRASLLAPLAPCIPLHSPEMLFLPPPQPQVSPQRSLSSGRQD